MSTERQTNFLGGELSPYLWGRTDLPIYQTGLRQCRNFFVSRAGALISRPGTKCVVNGAGVPVKTKYATNSDHSKRPVRLIPFIYSDSDSVVLEFGYQYVRFIVNGVQLESAPGTPYEGGTPYLCADLPQLQWAQSGDVLTLTHPNYAPQQLRRYGPMVWALVEMPYKRPDLIWVGSVAPDFDTNPVQLAGVTAGDATHPPKPWVWQVTALMEELLTDPVTSAKIPTGRVFESMPFTITQDSAGVALIAKIAVYLDLAINFVRVIGSAITPAFRVRGYQVYRGLSPKLLGFIGAYDVPVGLGFVDVGDEPNYAIQPPAGTHPFKVFNTTGTLNRTEHPAAVAYFQDKYCFGGTLQRPGGFFTSKTGDYSNFDLHDTIHVSGEALYFELATRKREEIRSMLPLSKLLVFTQSSVWSLAGSGGPLDFDSIDARVELAVGATHVPALATGDAAIFVRNKGTGVHAVKPAAARVGFDGADLSLPAQHLFAGHAILDWCHAQDPWGVVWAIRDDFKLISLTYDPDVGHAAWALHDADLDTDGSSGFGNWRAIASVPETDQDAVYLVQTDYVIVRMCGRNLLTGLAGDPTGETGDAHTNVGLDAYVTQVLTNPSTTVPPTLTLPAHLEGHKVYVTGWKNPLQGPFTVTSGHITLSSPPATPFLTLGGDHLAVLHIGQKFTPQIQTLDYAPPSARTAQKTVTEVAFEVVETQGLSAGPDFDNLDEVQMRDVSDSYNGTAPQTGQQRKYISGGYNSAGRAVLRQTQPLVATVVGLTRELDVGGK